MVDVYKEFIEHSGWDVREGQADAVDLLCQLVDSDAGESLAIQAPTGTGKSLAALLAGVFSKREGKGRVVIATYSVILTDQYIEDIKAVSPAFPDVKFAILKGSSNYPCLVNANNAMTKVKYSGNRTRLKDMANELRLYKKGLRDVPWWAASSIDACTDHSEGEKRNCDYWKARDEATRADVVVTNHAMLRCDMEGDESGRILGKYKTVILDEAHKVKDSLVYNEIFSLKKLEQMMEAIPVAEVLGDKKTYELVNHMQEIKNLPAWHARENEWVNPSPGLGEKLLSILPSGREITELTLRLTSDKTFNSADFSEIQGTLTLLAVMGIVCSEIAEGLGTNETSVWLSAGNGYKVQNMRVSEGFNKSLEKHVVGWISATIGTVRNPTYCLDSIGIDTAYISVQTPFDFEKQMDWTVIDWSASTRRDVSRWFREFRNGGKLILTGSHKKKEDFENYLGSENEGVFIQQGRGSDAQTKFKSWAGAGKNPVLVGVDVFSTGLNLSGDLCTGVLIDGIKPMRLDKAYVAQRKRWMALKGRDGFEDFELPERAIALEQQIGRLIRSKECVGSVVFYCNAKKGSVDMKILQEAMRPFEGSVYKTPAALGV